jgi:Cu(I)/Ag(I) efflux system membrane protein CusA/SilA
MVVYLEEAVAKKRADLGGRLTHDGLIAAIKEGARLRLRPKVMTVATTVASLLPIFWLDRTGVEIMRPWPPPWSGACCPRSSIS